jgi:hypothetical protein
MGAAQADHPNHAVAFGARQTMRDPVDHAVQPETRLGETVILDIGQHFEIRGASERHAMLGEVGRVFRRIEFDIDGIL